MTRAQSHTSTAGRAGKHSQEHKARKLEVRLKEALAAANSVFVVNDKFGVLCRTNLLQLRPTDRLP